jgi:uncharacterized protein (TIGR03067 family)
MTRYAVAGLVLVLAAVLLVTADAPKEDATRKEMEKLAGTWVLVSGEDDGKKLSAEAIKNARLTFAGDRHTVTVGETTFKGTHKLDPTKRPRTIDITDTEGPFKGKTVLGVYELDGDQFRICYAPPGKDRPRDFSARAGTGHRSHVWKRAKK